MNEESHEKICTVVTAVITRTPSGVEKNIRKVLAEYQLPESSEICKGRFWLQNPEIVNDVFQETLIKKKEDQTEEKIGFARCPVAAYDKHKTKRDDDKKRLINLYTNEGAPSLFVFTNGYKHQLKNQNAG